MNRYFKTDYELDQHRLHARGLRRAHLLAAREKGTHTAEDWDDMINSANYSCAKCGYQSPFITKDHILAIACGGSDSIRNIQPLCMECNGSKSSGKPVDYRVGKPWMRPEWSQDGE